MQIDIEELLKLVRSDDAITCPHCSHSHKLTDREVCQQVTSYWGDDLHDFTCIECGKDFVVKELVTRKYETAKTAKEL